MKLLEVSENGESELAELPDSGCVPAESAKNFHLLAPIATSTPCSGLPEFTEAFNDTMHGNELSDVSPDQKSGMASQELSELNEFLEFKKPIDFDHFENSQSSGSSSEEMATDSKEQITQIQTKSELPEEMETTSEEQITEIQIKSKSPERPLPKTSKTVKPNNLCPICNKKVSPGSKSSMKATHDQFLRLIRASRARDDRIFRSNRIDQENLYLHSKCYKPYTNHARVDKLVREKEGLPLVRKLRPNSLEPLVAHIKNYLILNGDAKLSKIIRTFSGHKPKSNESLLTKLKGVHGLTIDKENGNHLDPILHYRRK